MRLDKYLAQNGMSRAQARSAIASGRVRVSGETARDAALKVDERADVALDGARLNAPGFVYAMMNKPAGVLTAARDARAETVLDRLPESFRARGAMPVGRLDKDVTGLLIFTDDGQLAHRLISPRVHAKKVYLASTEGAPDEDALNRLRAGLPLKDFTAAPAEAERMPDGRVRLTIGEGKHHQVKRMFATVGCPVKKLERVAFGGVRLDPALARGETRALKDAEIAALYAAAGLPVPDARAERDGGNGGLQA